MSSGLYKTFVVCSAGLGGGGSVGYEEGVGGSCSVTEVDGGHVSKILFPVTERPYDFYIEVTCSPDHWIIQDDVKITLTLDGVSASSDFKSLSDLGNRYRVIFNRGGSDFSNILFSLTSGSNLHVEIFNSNPKPPNKFKIKIGDEWKEPAPYVRVNGAWRRVTASWVNVDGVWKRSEAPKIEKRELKHRFIPQRQGSYPSIVCGFNESMGDDLGGDFYKFVCSYSATQDITSMFGTIINGIKYANKTGSLFLSGGGKVEEVVLTLTDSGEIHSVNKEDYNRFFNLMADAASSGEAVDLVFRFHY